ncbi:MAG: PP-loop family protein [Desulfovibrio sp.]|uniref:PP-loop family protein n=1 Tax=Desulfovibrio sp. TaxID=885 RepID=UPI0039E31946
MDNKSEPINAACAVKAAAQESLLVSCSEMRPEDLPKELTRILRDLPPLVVALSGGIDSRFLCHAAQLCGCDVLAVHARGPHITAGESAGALSWAERRGLPLLVVDFNPLSLPEVSNNSQERCYACKAGLLAAIGAALAQAGQLGRVLCDGSNADDLNAFRPGLRALKEAGVVSPLAQAGMSKATIRNAARATGLDDPGQRARPCLLTRLAYGLEPQKETLARLAAAEEELAALTLADHAFAGVEAMPDAASPTAAPSLDTKTANGESTPKAMPCVEMGRENTAFALGDLRLRLTPQPVLQVENLPPELVGKVEETLVRHGFFGCELRVGQGISGFYDRQKG